MNPATHIEKLRKDIARNCDEIKTLEEEMARHQLEILALEIKINNIRSLIDLKNDAQTQRHEIIAKYELLQAAAN